MQHDKLLVRKVELDIMLSQRRIELARPEAVREYVEDLRQFLDSSDLPGRRAFIKGFIKEVRVLGNEGRIRYTFPIPPDNHDEETLGVLPFVCYGGLSSSIAKPEIETFFEVTLISGPSVL